MRGQMRAQRHTAEQHHPRHRVPRVNRRDLHGNREPPGTYRPRAKPPQTLHGGVLDTFRRLRAFGLVHKI